MNSVHNMVLQYHWPTYIHSLLSYLQARHVSGSFNLFSTVPADVSGKCLTIMLCTWSVFWGALVPLPYEPSSFLGAQYVPLNHSAVVVLLWFGKRKDLSPPADSFPCFSIVCGMVCYKEGKHMDHIEQNFRIEDTCVIRLYSRIMSNSLIHIVLEWFAFFSINCLGNGLLTSPSKKGQWVFTSGHVGTIWHFFFCKPKIMHNFKGGAWCFLTSKTASPCDCSLFILM